MKAVIVVEMPNDIDISKVRIGGDGNIYYIRDGEKASIVGNIRNIKPLPKKKNTEIVIKGHTGEIARVYQDGWNACIDELTGKTDGEQ